MDTPPTGGPAADARLARAIEDRQPEAIAEAYRLHGTAVRGLAWRLCGEQADDVVQDVFVRLWKQPGAYDPGRASLRAYLMLQARSRSIDLLRSDVARRRREAADGTDRSRDGADDRDGAGRGVLGLLDRLSLVQREAIALAFVEGHTYQEVARLLDEAEGTIKGRIRSGLLALRELLTEADPAIAG